MSTALAGTPLVLSAAEQPVFAQLYAKADPTQSGVVTGDAAVRFFEGFRLPTLTLGQIWSIADSDNNGFLTPNTFSVALRLIARAQRGESVSPAVVNTPGAPPTYNGAILAQPEAHDAILPEDRARFSRIFAMSGPRNGLLSGENAKVIFLKSKLPYETLGSIWNLADTKSRGSLDLTDFIIGMHYIQGLMNGTISHVPAVLPAGMYEQAAGLAQLPTTSPPTPASGVASFRTPSISQVPPAAPLRAQSTGASQLQSTLGPMNAAGVASPVPQTPRADNWSISAAEKTRFDGFFDSLDTTKSGSLEGSLVVPFFLQSGLDETTLAHVWDLADVSQSGTLSREEFAIAMKLISERISGTELPQTLPHTLLPSSIRQQELPAAAGTKQSETQRELFSLIDDDVPASTGAAASAFAAPQTQSPASIQPRGSVVDDEFFAPGGGAAAGMGLSPSASRAAAADSRQAIADTGAEFDSAKQQLESTNKALGGLGTRRADAESATTRGATTLAELTAQLERARASHATETEAVSALEGKVKQQNTEIESLRQEVIRAESELSALRTHKDELEQQLLADRETARETRQRLAAVQSEVASLREANVGRARDAQHQAGVSAAAHSQLAAALEEKERSRSIPTPTARRTNPFERLENLFSGSAPDGLAHGVTGAAASKEAGADAGVAAEPAEKERQDVQAARGEPPAAAAAAEEQSSEGDDAPEDADGYALRKRDTNSELHGASYISAVTSMSSNDRNKDNLPGSFPDMPGGLGTLDDTEERQERAVPAQIPSSRTMEDFDAAFENLGLANVVHSASGETPTRELGFEDAFEGFGNARPPAPAAPVADTHRVVHIPAGTSSTTPAAPITFPIPPGAPTAASMPWTVGASRNASAAGTPTAGTPVPTAAPTHAAAPAPAAAGPARVPTPPRASDSAQVRQLCHMGFSRSAVVGALERSGQRMERALEIILAQNAK